MFRPFDSDLAGGIKNFFPGGIFTGWMPDACEPAKIAQFDKAMYFASLVKTRKVTYDVLFSGY